jgi:hypothetical protein
MKTRCLLFKKTLGKYRKLKDKDNPTIIASEIASLLFFPMFISI